MRAGRRLLAAQARLLRSGAAKADAVIVGYPGQADLDVARRVARDRPVVFNPLVSWWDTLTADRARFGTRSPAGRALLWLDRHAFRSADLVVADTQANADFFAALAGLGAGRVAT